MTSTVKTHSVHSCTVADLAGVALRYSRSMDSRARAAAEALRGVALNAADQPGESSVIYVNVWTSPDGRTAKAENAHTKLDDAIEEIINVDELWTKDGYGYACTLTEDGSVDLYHLAEQVERGAAEDSAAYQRAATLATRQLVGNAA